jgi:hypothetical protein
MRSYWLSLKTAIIQHPIELGPSTCFSLSLSAYTEPIVIDVTAEKNSSKSQLYTN